MILNFMLYNYINFVDMEKREKRKLHMMVEAGPHPLGRHPGGQVGSSTCHVSYARVHRSAALCHHVLKPCLVDL